MEGKIDRFMSFMDRASVILGIVAVAGAIGFIILPALWAIWR
ncbi:MAG: hypothetical protein A4E65_00284 [Syntrophorhabdus sp. PtaU1.Bin153]|nr:MAG: hypothetical protein A4E65_00284 [Syntrophorhabdus sp. PtaU1.Bin153]